MTDYRNDWMWSEACEVLARAERMHREFFRPVRTAARVPAFEPPVDVLETDRAVLVFIALPEVDPGVRKKLRFLNPELGLINLKDPIRLHISALGPKGRQMVARHGAAWKTVMSGVDDGLAALRGMQKTWTDSGRSAADLYASAWVWGCILRDGETLDSPRVRAEAGPRAAVLLHRAADLDMEGWINTSPVPDSIKATLEGYVETARRFEPSDARYLLNHTGHCLAVKPEEEKFVTAELIRQTTFTGTEQDIKQRVEAMRDGGLSQLVIPVVPNHEAAIEDWGRIIKAFR